MPAARLDPGGDSFSLAATSANRQPSKVSDGANHVKGGSATGTSVVGHCPPTPSGLANRQQACALFSSSPHHPCARPRQTAAARLPAAAARGQLRGPPFSPRTHNMHAHSARSQRPRPQGSTHLCTAAGTRERARAAMRRGYTARRRAAVHGANKTANRGERPRAPRHAADHAHGGAALPRPSTTRAHTHTHRKHSARARAGAPRRVVDGFMPPQLRPGKVAADKHVSPRSLGGAVGAAARRSHSRGRRAPRAGPPPLPPPTSGQASGLDGHTNQPAGTPALRRLPAVHSPALLRPNAPRPGRSQGPRAAIVLPTAAGCPLPAQVSHPTRTRSREDGSR